MSDQAQIAEALRLRAANPSWGYIKIGKEIGLDKDKVRRAIEHAQRKQGLPAAITAAGAISFYDMACQALTQAKDLSEVKDIADKASALKEYGRRAGDRRLEIDAAELRIRAERRFGEMMTAVELSAGRPRKNGADKEPFPTLEELGVTKKLSSRSQKLASISERAMEARLAQWRERAERGAERVTVDLLRDGDKKERRARREADLAGKILALPDKKYGVILADPEWRFETYSRETGMDRAADNHYPTSSVDAIAARPVQDIAADDCVLFLWATAPMLPEAIGVMIAWDFKYRSQIVWVKDRIGTGYWFRNQHEHLLVGTRGNVPAPAMGTQWPSIRKACDDRWIAAHSVKPDWQYELIEAYFPTLPKIELNARRARSGWDSWGLDAPPHDPITGEVKEAAE